MAVLQRICYFFNKGLHIFFFVLVNAATQVGKTCAVLIVDEIAAMIHDEESKMSDQHEEKGESHS